jgi:predicted ATPase
MLTRLDLRLFKCFELLRLPLAPLTLLSGPNSSGKSSVLQVLVLLHQTMREHEWSTRLSLNGSGVHLGTVVDVVDEVHGRNGFEVGVAAEESSCRWAFDGDRREMSMRVCSVSVDGCASEAPTILRHLLPPKADGSVAPLAARLRGLTYITAERVGPQEAYPLEDPYDVVVGSRGEHAVSVLHWGRDEPVLPALALPGAPRTLLRQVQSRMRTLFPGCGVDLQQVPQTNAVTLGLRTSDETGFHRPIHTGFGLTQILPIAVAALSAKAGDLMLIENPEVHLHPAGQASMGRFLADVARAGVQVIVETHSDHVLNGIRRAVKSERLGAEQVLIHFFRPRSEDGAQVHSPTLDAAGNIDIWPEGFFDQFDKDMNYFAGWGN